MADEHPLMGAILSNIPPRKDLELWCGATFVLDIINQTEGMPLMFFGDQHFTDYAETVKQFKATDSSIHYYYTISSIFDKMVLNIRQKSGSWSDLGPVLWSFEFPCVLPSLKDKPLTAGDLLTSHIEIDAEITQEMLNGKYTYELIMITDEIFDSTLKDSGPLYTYKHLRMYGNIITHQVGEL